LAADWAHHVPGVNSSLARIIERLVLTGDPPELGATVDRLLATGIGPDQTGLRVARVVEEWVGTLLSWEGEWVDFSPLDRLRLIEMLDRLPESGVPSVEEDIAFSVSEQGPTSPPPELLNPGFIAGDHGDAHDTSDWIRFADGIVMTHRITDSELPRLDLGADLALLDVAFPFRLSSNGALVTHRCTPDGCQLDCAEGWDLRLQPGDLLCVRLTIDEPNSSDDATNAARLVLTRLDEVASTPTIRDLATRAYASIDAGGGPVSVRQLTTNMLDRRPDCFEQATVPISELIEELGWELRGRLIADRPDRWRTHQRRDLYAHAARTALSPVQRAQVRAAFDAATRAENDERSSLATLDSLSDPVVLGAFSASVFDQPDLHELNQLDHFLDRVERVAARGRHRAVCAWLRALIAERRGRPLEARDHLESGHRADPEWGPVAERLAWAQLDAGEFDAATDTDRRLAAEIGQLQLSDSVYRLWHSLAAFLTRQTGATSRLLDHLDAVPFGPSGVEPQGLERSTFTLPWQRLDPLVAEVVLLWFGGIRRYLELRSELLEPPLAELAARWEPCRRSAYDIVGLDPGRSITLRDLTTKDRISVIDTHSLGSRLSLEQVVCALVVADLESRHVLLGPVFDVIAEDEESLIEICEAEDAHRLIQWARRATLLSTGAVGARAASSGTNSPELSGLAIPETETATPDGVDDPFSPDPTPPADVAGSPGFEPQTSTSDQIDLAMPPSTDDDTIRP